MEVRINKKRTIKIVIILVAIILIGIGGYYVLNNIKINNEINETEQKIKNIDASELQNNLINAFKKTNINLQGNGYFTAFGEAKDLTMMINDNETLSKEYLGDFICAGFLVSDKSESGIAVFPLFKIESDSNGKVKNIIYLDISTKVYSFSDLVKKTVEQVLKDNYNIDTVIRGNSKYNIKFYGTSRDYANGSAIGNYKAYKLSEKLSIYGTSDTIIKNVINKIAGYEDYYGSKLELNIFGLDIFSTSLVIDKIEEKISNPIATMDIENYGTIKIELYPEQAPNTVKNFIALSNNGFYDNLTFHRVIYGFMIQGGDKNGNGTGNPSLSDIDKTIQKNSSKDTEYTIKGEFKENGVNNELKLEKGSIAMARADYTSYSEKLLEQSYNSAGSQFFIMTEDYFELDGLYATFGKVIEGMNVVKELEYVGTDEEGNTYEPPIIKSIRVETEGYDYGLPETLKTFDFTEWVINNSNIEENEDKVTNNSKWLSDNEYYNKAIDYLKQERNFIFSATMPGLYHETKTELINIEKNAEKDIVIVTIGLTNILSSSGGYSSTNYEFDIQFDKNGNAQKILNSNNDEVY